MKFKILSSVLLLIPVLVFAQLKGKVVAVHDGDTFTLLTSDNKQIKIRLHGIDCPELSQDFGNVAKQYVSSIIFGKTVSVKKVTIDKYRRTVGIVILDDSTTLNEKLLLAGLAWHYIKYDKAVKLDSLQNIAKKMKLGLWKIENPTPPWDYRKHK